MVNINIKIQFPNVIYVEISKSAHYKLLDLQRKIVSTISSIILREWKFKSPARNFSWRYLFLDVRRQKQLTKTHLTLNNFTFIHEFLKKQFWRPLLYFIEKKQALMASSLNSTPSGSKGATPTSNSLNRSSLGGNFQFQGNSYILHWNFDWKKCFVEFFLEWNEWKNPQFNFSSQILSIERNFFKWDGKETKISHLLFNRIWKNYFEIPAFLPI